MVEVSEGENPINPMKNKHFDNEAQAVAYIKTEFDDKSPYVLDSELGEFFDLSIKIFVDPRYNTKNEQNVIGNKLLHKEPTTGFNGTGIYLTSTLEKGLSGNGLSGKIFIIGKYGKGTYG